MNIRLSYLYRDGGNYKQFNDVVYTNKANLSLTYIRETLKSYLIEEAWFYAEHWGLQDLHAFAYDKDMDHNYHELEDIEETTYPPTSADILQLIERLDSA